jgi:hypothetical protein
MSPANPQQFSASDREEAIQQDIAFPERCGSEVLVDIKGGNLGSTKITAEVDLTVGQTQPKATGFYAVEIEMKTTSTTVHEVYVILGDTTVATLNPSIANLRTLAGSGQIFSVILNGAGGTNEINAGKVRPIANGLEFDFVSILMGQGFTDDIFGSINLLHPTAHPVQHSYYQVVNVD